MLYMCMYKIQQTRRFSLTPSSLLPPSLPPSLTPSLTPSSLLPPSSLPPLSSLPPSLPPPLSLSTACGINVHKRCERMVPHNCGINQKDLAKVMEEMGVTPDQLRGKGSQVSVSASLPLPHSLICLYIFPSRSPLLLCYPLHLCLLSFSLLRSFSLPPLSFCLHTLSISSLTLPSPPPLSPSFSLSSPPPLSFSLSPSSPSLPSLSLSRLAEGLPRAPSRPVARARSTSRMEL